MPIIEKSPPRKINIAKGMTPISLVLSGKLNTPVPMALANNAKIDPLRDPSCIGPKYLYTNLRLSLPSSVKDSLISAFDKTDYLFCYSVSIM